MKKQVSKILDEFSKIDKKKIPTKGDSIDMSKFYNVPEVVEVVKKLKDIGATSKWLMDNGFVAAGMLLRIK